MLSDVLSDSPDCSSLSAKAGVAGAETDPEVWQLKEEPATDPGLAALSLQLAVLSAVCCCTAFCCAVVCMSNAVVCMSKVWPVEVLL